MPSPLSLPAELTIRSAAEIRPSWLAWLADPGADGRASVDGAAVLEADSAGLQLLQSLANTLAAQNAAMELLRPSPALRKACESMGLHALLGACEGAGA